MNRFVALLLILCTVAASAQQGLPEAPTPNLAAPRNPAWERMQTLAPGMAVSVLAQGSFDAVPCQLDYVSDEAFACTPYRNYGPPPRLVFPRQAVRAVWGEAQAESSPWAPVIVAGSIVGIFTIVGGTQGGGQGAGIGALFGCLLAGGVLAAMGSQERMPPHLHTRRRILYRAP